MATWPNPDYWHLHRKIRTPTSIQRYFLDTIIPEKFNRFDKWFCKTSKPIFRTFQLSFYSDIFLVEFLIASAFEDKCTIYSYLVNGSEFEVVDKENTAAADSNDDISGIYWLNGTSPPIHEVNAKYKFSVISEEIALSYLRFFCAHIWGEKGGFWLVESIDDLPWIDQNQTDIKNETAKLIRGPVLKEHKDGTWAFDVTTCYDAHLFSVEMLIQSGGMIEMLNDEPLRDTPLPISADCRVDGARVLKY